MIADELGRQLHDKATSGVALTPQERAQLEEWYRHQDGVESQGHTDTKDETTVAALRRQVAEALAQFQTVTVEIQNLAGANEALRCEVAALRERVARRPVPQSA